MKSRCLRVVAVVVLFFGALFLSLASIDFDDLADDPELEKCCAWEQRHGECGGSASTGEWEQRCIEAEAGSQAYDSQCETLDDDTTECGGSCCLNYEYRNLQFLDGSCADNGYLAL